MLGKFKGYIFNASGVHCTTEEELIEIGESDSAAIMIKSCTLKPREGNPKPRFVEIPNGNWIQAMGLPNPGYESYIKMIPKLTKFNKPIIISIAGPKIKDYVKIINAFNETDVNLIEINLSCPNIGKEPLAYHPERASAIFEVLDNIKKPLGLKLPIFVTDAQRLFIYNLIEEYRLNFVTLINSIGGCSYADVKELTTATKPKYAALSGPALLSVALGQVKKFRDMYGKNDFKPIIFGCGGINSGEDALNFLLHGASAVQVGVALHEEGLGIFKRLNTELNKIMTHHNMNSLEDVHKKGLS